MIANFINHRRLLSRILLTLLPLCVWHSSLASEAVRTLIVPVNEAKLSSQLAARITHINVKTGSKFSKGDTLIRFDCGLHQAELNKSLAELKSAQAKLSSNKKLRSLGSGSDLDLAIALSEVNKTKAQRARARELVKHCQVLAPFNGRVHEIFVNRFESVRQGDSLIDILDDKHLRLEMFVPSSWSSWLKIGDSFDVKIGETGKHYKAKVNMIGARVDPVSQSIALYGEIDNSSQDLLAGMSGTASFSQSADQ